MILHAGDWGYYPNAIADTTTKNASFLHYAKTLTALGVENHAWPLALHNPEIQGIDPFNSKLTVEEVAAISYESKFNYWYFLREVSRVPQTGTTIPSCYLANRANMALNWCFLNNIDFANIMPRQCGKSVGADVLNNWLMHVSGVNLNIQLITRGDDLRVKNIKRLKAIRDLLPPYLNFYRPGKDANNTERLTCMALENEYVTAVAQKDKAAADNLGRGLTSSIIQADEPPYCANIHISLPVALAGAGTARDLAEANGTFYGNIYTTTAGKKDTPEGKYMYDLIHSGMYWTEKLLDAGSREQAWDMIALHSKRRLVNGTFSHRQIGKDDEWLRKKIIDSTGDKDAAERDYLNQWTSGSESSPLSVALNRAVAQSKKEATYTQRFKQNYLLDWFIGRADMQSRLMNNEIILNIDPSQLVGEDGNGVVIEDLRNMEVIAGTDITTSNIFSFASWVTDMLVMFKKMTLVIENAASGQAILDIVAHQLMQLGINPFRRIFNRVIDNPISMKAAYLDVVENSDKCEPELYEKYKKYFGFNTNGATRPLLYGMVLQKAAKSTAHLCNHPALVEQILSLVKKNGRVDHPSGGHDDMVIAWLLGHWFSTYAQNLAWYGIRPGVVQSLVSELGAELSDEEIRDRIFREGLIKRINGLKEKLETCNDIVLTQSYSMQIKLLVAQLDDTDFEAKVMADIRAISEEKGKEKRSLSQILKEENKYY